MGGSAVDTRRAVVDRVAVPGDFRAARGLGGPMGSSMLGADPDQLADTSRQWVRVAGRLAILERSLSARLVGTPWTGSDREEVISWWHSGPSPRLQAAGRRIEAAARTLVTNAEDQRRTSDPVGVVPPGTPGPDGGVVAAPSAPSPVRPDPADIPTVKETDRWEFGVKIGPLGARGLLDTTMTTYSDGHAEVLVRPGAELSAGLGGVGLEGTGTGGAGGRFLYSFPDEDGARKFVGELGDVATPGWFESLATPGGPPVAAALGIGAVLALHAQSMVGGGVDGTAALSGVLGPGSGELRAAGGWSIESASRGVDLVQRIEAGPTLGADVGLVSGSMTGRLGAEIVINSETGPREIRLTLATDVRGGVDLLDAAGIHGVEWDRAGLGAAAGARIRVSLPLDDPDLDLARVLAAVAAPGAAVGSVGLLRDLAARGTWSAQWFDGTTGQNGFSTGPLKGTHSWMDGEVRGSWVRGPDGEWLMVR